MMLDVLTERQREICDLTVKGYTVKEIAKMTGESHRAVEVQKYRALRRLHIDGIHALCAVYVHDRLSAYAGQHPAIDDVLAFVGQSLP